MAAERHEFQAETRKLLDLMIHSLYSHKEIFLRELISNASDAIDRRSFEALTDPSLGSDEGPRILIRIDPEARYLEVSDNGIGMSEAEVIENLGTIARSGTELFSHAQEKAKTDKNSAEGAPELIGQFGVGFYASFMVASEVRVETRKLGEDSSTRWHSAGDGGFEVGEGDRSSPGTCVRLELLPIDAEAGRPDFCDEFVLRQTVKRYSDFVAHPIELEIVGAERKGPEGPLNSMKAIWTRPEAEVSEEEHRDFYRHIAHDWSDPLFHLQARIEGNFEARALLYVPSQAPFDLYHREQAHRGVQLYVKRVFIMDDCRDLLPEWLRFVRGVVDSEDLPLNVSREMLQQDRQIQTIRKHLVKRLLEKLTSLAKDDSEKYLEFWGQFGPVLKEGLLGAEERREQILDLVRAPSTHASALTSLAEVVERMDDAQDKIYYLTGTSREAVERSPHLEAFREKDVEVLFFSDPVDDVWLEQGPPEFQGKTWQSVGRGEVELGSEQERKEADESREQETEALGDLLSGLRVALQEQVAEVRPSRRLTSSPACLVVAEGDVSPQIKAMLRQAGQDVPDSKPILEVNGSHELLQRLGALHAKDPKDARIADCAQLLYAQAALVEGATLDDPADFGRRLTDWLLRALP